MRALRVVGITEGGGELSVVLEDPARRERFVVSADEQLRAAARGDLTRLGQIAIELESQLRPREIQARIRAGASVEQVASAAGVPVQKIERFAYPVLLERSRTAEVAQRAHPVRADGPDSRMLGDVVAHTFGLRGQEYHTAEWDSWKGEDSRWVVALSWRAGRSDNRAHWTFQPGAHGGTVTAVDEHAHDLVEGLPARPLRTVGPVIDIARSDEPQPAPDGDAHGGRELRAAASEGARGWAPEHGRVATERPPTRTAPEPRRPEAPLVRRSEPSRPEAGRAEPSRAEPSRPEPSRPEPSRPEPGRPEPGRAEPLGAEALQRPVDGGRLPDPRRDTDRPSAPVIEQAPDYDLSSPVDEIAPSAPVEPAPPDGPAAAAPAGDDAAATGPATAEHDSLPAGPVPATATPAEATPAETSPDVPAETAPDVAPAAGSDRDIPPGPATADEPRKPPAARRGKKGKPVMPSWDEVLLGVRGQR